MRLAARAARWALSGFLTATAVPALAQGGPEQLDQIEPGAGEWQAEYFGAFGGDGEQAVEVLAGVSDRLALGGELEMEGPRDGLRLDSLSLTALYRVSDPEAQPVGFGIEVQASIGRDARIAGAEARAIVEVRRRGWWAQADAILRQSREDHRQGTGTAYGASIQRSLGDRGVGPARPAVRPGRTRAARAALCRPEPDRRTTRRESRSRAGSGLARASPRTGPGIGAATLRAIHLLEAGGAAVAPGLVVSLVMQMS